MVERPDGAAPLPPAGVVVVMGVSGCGKTTVGRLLAEALAVPFLEGDDFHPPENVARMAAGLPLDDSHREPWLDALAEAAAAIDGAGVVVTCSALKRAYRARLATALPGVRFVHLEGEETVIRGRMELRRDHFMPPALLRSQFEVLERPTVAECALLVDVDRSPRQLVVDIVKWLKVPI